MTDFTLTPTTAKPGDQLTITGTDLPPAYYILFKAGADLVATPATVAGYSALVPNQPAGEYEVIIQTVSGSNTTVGKITIE